METTTPRAGEQPRALIRIHVTAGTPKDRATATVDGRDYEARSSSAGVPDQPYEVVNTAAPGIVSMRGPSVHAAAGLTVEQRDAREPRFARFVPHPGNASRPYGERPPVSAEPEGATPAGAAVASLVAPEVRS